MIRLESFDLAEPRGRSKERYRRIAYSASAGALARVVGVAISLALVPLTFNYLGAERYGMWLTMSSVVAMLSFTDLGIGNGLVNVLAESYGRREYDAARNYVSSALTMLSVIALVLGFVFYLSYSLVPWSALFNVRDPTAVAEAGPAVFVLASCFLLGLPLGVISRVRFGLQEGFVDTFWAIVAGLISLGFVLVAIRMELGLPYLVAAIAGMPLLAPLCNGFVLWLRDHPELRPSLSYANKRAIRRIAHLGIFFFILQISAAVAYQSDNLVVAQVLGAAQVPQYAVPMKLFSIIPMILAFFLAPMWPAYADAFARGDDAWARVALRRSVLLSLWISGPLALILMVGGQPLIHVWVGPSIAAEPILLIGLALWSVTAAMSATVATFLNAAGVVRPQAVFAVAMMAANLLLSILLTKTIGVSGVVYGSLIAQLVFIATPVAVLVRRQVSRMKDAV